MGTLIEWTCPDCGMAQPISLRQVALACPACGFRLEESEGLQFVRKAIVDALWPMADRSCPKGEISQRIQTRLGELGLWKKLPGDYAELSVCDLIVVFLLMQEKGWLEELAEMPIESVKPYMWRALEIKAEPILSICEAFVNGEEAAINRVGKAIQDNPNAVVPVESFFAFRDWSCDEETQDEILACLAKGVRNLGKSAASTVKKFSPQTRRMLWRVNLKLP